MSGVSPKGEKPSTQSTSLELEARKSKRPARAGPEKRKDTPESPQPETLKVNMVLFLILMYSVWSYLVLQKRCRVDYGSDDDELERVLAELEGSSDPATGDRSRRAASSAMSEKTESSDPFDSVELVESLTSHFDLQIQDPASKDEVLMEFAPL